MTMLFAVMKNDNIIRKFETLVEAREFLTTPSGNNGVIIYSKRAREMYKNGELDNLTEM